MPLPTLWHDGVPPPATDGGALPAAVEVVVVGAGITGLTTAVLLARAGFSVAVLEARAVAAGTTGASTAKVSLLQGTMLARIARRHPAAVVDSYVEANRAGQTWLQRFCQEHAVPAQLRTAVTFAVGERGERDARAELEAGRRAGLPVSWVDRLDLPFRTRGGVQLLDQMQTDPVALSHALVQDARAHGATVHEGVRVLRVTDTPTAVVETDAGEVWADVVIIATGMPILDRGGFFARMEPHRSYLLAFRTAEPPPSAMYLSADQPGRSLRDGSRDGERILLVGGAGHVTGRTPSERRHLDELRSWTKRWWPGAEETHAWSAQDHTTARLLPFAGPLAPGADRVLVAGGFAKWGMTNGVASALGLAARMTGERVAWSATYDPWGHLTSSELGAAARMNGRVAVELARGWIGLGERPRPEASDAVGLSRVCTHLGGKVMWNDAERTWDCPLHGSRFDVDGTVLDAPASCGLRRAVTGP